MTLIFALILFAIVICFCLPFLYFGAWYAPSTHKGIEMMLDMLTLKPGEKVLDLGSGDGKIVIAASKRGVQATGYEINPILVWISKWRVQGRGKIERANFWKKDLGEFDAIIIFGVSYVMKGLEEKLKRELKPGVRVVTNYFTFPTWQPSLTKNGITVYTQQ